jgi:hypothetical protein
MSSKIPVVDVLLKGGSNDHFATRAGLYEKSIKIPTQFCCGEEKYVRTTERAEVKQKDGTLRTYRVYAAEEG